MKIKRLPKATWGMFRISGELLAHIAMRILEVFSMLMMYPVLLVLSFLEDMND